MRLVFFIVVFFFVGSAVAEETGKDLDAAIVMGASDWPCKTDYRAELPESPSWPGPALLEQAVSWREAPDMKLLVEAVAASSRNEQAILKIDRFASGLAAEDTERDRLLTAVFIGLRDEMILYREMVLYGIMKGVAKARLASDIAASTKQDASGSSAMVSEALRAEDDALDEARFLCRRLGALEEKFHLLAKALAGHLTPASG